MEEPGKVIVCEGKGCPLKEDCLRFVAKPLNNWTVYSKIVSYLSPPYRDNECSELISKTESEQSLR